VNRGLPESSQNRTMRSSTRSPGRSPTLFGSSGSILAPRAATISERLRGTSTLQVSCAEKAEFTVSLPSVRMSPTDIHQFCCGASCMRSRYSFDPFL
jgi:hypothetical protein